MSDEINRSLGEIKGTLVQFQRDTERRFDDLKEDIKIEIKMQLNEQGEKITSLEKSRVAAMATSGAIGGVFGFLGSTGIGKALATIIGSH